MWYLHLMHILFHPMPMSVLAKSPYVVLDYSCMDVVLTHLVHILFNTHAHVRSNNPPANPVCPHSTHSIALCFLFFDESYSSHFRTKSFSSPTHFASFIAPILLFFDESYSSQSRTKAIFPLCNLYFPFHFLATFL